MTLYGKNVKGAAASSDITTGCCSTHRAKVYIFYTVLCFYTAATSSNPNPIHEINTSQDKHVHICIWRPGERRRTPVEDKTFTCRDIDETSYVRDQGRGFTSPRPRNLRKQKYWKRVSRSATNAVNEKMLGDIKLKFRKAADAVDLPYRTGERKKSGHASWRAPVEFWLPLVASCLATKGLMKGGR